MAPKHYVQGKQAMVTPLPFVGDHRALVQALRAGHPGAAAAFYDQHSAHVYKILRSTVESESDVPDLLQEVFIRALDNIDDLEEPDLVRSWITSIAVFTARAHIRRAARRNFLGIFSSDKARDKTRPIELEPSASDARFALREIYQVLDTMPASERMAFVLRIVDGMTLPDGARACRTKLATFHRRLARAENQFLAAIARRPALKRCLENGTRWKLPIQG
jgi:RNA polymerase sigma-70 factor (ECF subfamily)